jgi:bifunctional N-acetylglucosamine-1-phosphate-uridyltransferase/glucosamine-1-phosphate-acetyltransferase GlmU-like protein
MARGVNTLAELWAIEHIKRSQIISYWMNNGVRFASGLNVIIDNDVIIEPGTFIGAGAHLLGKTIIKKNSEIGPFTYIKDSTLEKNVKVQPHAIIIKSTIEEDCTVQALSKISHQHVSNAHKKSINQDSPSFTGAIKDEKGFNEYPL